MSFHLHVEVKIDGVWDHFDCCNDDAFATTIKIFANRRGIPRDATFLTRSDYNLSSHSCGWLSAEEISNLVSVPVDIPEYIEDVRFIFWKD